jgi:F-type H+/Na+-transporting ATPase subunit alpha
MAGGFRIDDIASVIREQIEHYKPEVEVAEVGRIMEVGDGIARVYGLARAKAAEMIHFPRTDTYGVALNLEEDSVGIAVMGDWLGLGEGDEARCTGTLLSVPVGDAMVGRVVDPLGRPLDGRGPIQSKERRPLESNAPGIAERQPVTEPLQTGIKAIDSMIPIGRGQRELIIGDRKTGKSAIAVDTIINQKGQGVICVYVAIGQKESTVASLVEVLRQHGAMDYTIVVTAGSSDPAPLQYIAPYAGCAMAEYFMYERGQGTLCIYDDLSKQAAAYRQLSLLLRRPPGREAYPGDVFYLHSRLLERAAKLAERYIIVDKKAAPETRKGANDRVYIGVPGKDEAAADLKKLNNASLEVRKLPGSGGSLTALPIVETLEGEVSAYIPTNVISITDGQIYLEPELFFSGVRPAINVGISVSRVGKNAQNKAMAKVSGSLRLDLASYRELEAFAQLGTDIDQATLRQLERGRRLVELLKQPQYRPYNATDETISIFAGTGGYMDDVPVSRVADFEQKMLEYMHARQENLWNDLNKQAVMSDDLRGRLTEAVKQFKSQYMAALPAAASPAAK